MHAPPLLFCLLLAAPAQDKTYDLKLETPRKAGQKARLIESEHMKMSMKANGQPAAANEEKKLFEAVEDVVAADGKGGEELRWAFSKAERLVEGEMKPYGFQGKTVVVKAKAGERSFSVADGGALSEEEVEALKKAFDDAGEDDVSKAFAPKSPVKVGESWSPDVAAVAAMLDDEMAASVDPKASKVRFTLKGVERREGADFGKIEGNIELSFGAMGPVKLETPIVMKLTAEMDVCIDGSSPLGVMKLKGEMKGGSDATVEGNKLRIDLDLTMVGLLSRTALK